MLCRADVIRDGRRIYHLFRPYSSQSHDAYVQLLYCLNVNLMYLILNQYMHKKKESAKSESVHIMKTINTILRTCVSTIGVIKCRNKIKDADRCTCSQLVFLFSWSVSEAAYIWLVYCRRHYYLRPYLGCERIREWQGLAWNLSDVSNEDWICSIFGNGPKNTCMQAFFLCYYLVRVTRRMLDWTNFYLWACSSVCFFCC